MGIYVHVLILMGCFIAFGEASIKCYSCSNPPEKKCGDIFGYFTPDAVSCAGTCIKRRGLRGSEKTVEIYRGCVQQTDNTCKNVQYNGITVRACTCNEDFCNHANHSASAITSVIVSVFISLLLLL